MKVACEWTSLFHHVIAAIVGCYVTYNSYDHIWTEASLGANSLYPFVSELQQFNIGYFLYDSIHVFTWDRKFIPHHIVALLGLGISEWTGVYALANAVNIFITEIGSMMYNWYNKNKTLNNYKIFVTAYTISRCFFVGWSYSVINQCFGYSGENEYVWWIPYFAVVLQIVLLVVNFSFLRTHINKLRALMRKRNRNE